ncbi:hypothetical protein AAVH_22344 [Aphelenchoides avenae]|nr:hypothetical protein AAVH_22344 [Aphelenchus avenae]
MPTDIGSLDIRQSALDTGHLPAARGAMTAFRRLGVLDIQHDVPLDFLTDEFLVAMVARRTTHVRVAAQINVPLGRSGGWGDHRHNECLAHDVHAKLRSVDNCAYLSTGLTAFMFRDYGYPFDDGIAHEEGQNGPHPSSNVELFFGAARVPSGICQTIMEAAVSSKSNYSIYVSFIAVTDVDIHLEGFEARERHDGCAWYKVPSLHDADVVNELFVSAVELRPNEYGFYGFNAFTIDQRGTRNGWTCIVFRRYRESDRRHLNSASVWGPS